MIRSIIGKWCFAIGAAGFAVYLAVIAVRTKDAGFVLMPYPWVWWLASGVVSFATAGAVMTDVVRREPHHTNASPLTEERPTRTPQDGAPLARAGAVTAHERELWIDHVGLRSQRDSRSEVRAVRWNSNGRAVGELRPSQSGGGFDVFDSAANFLGSVCDEEAGIELLKFHDSRPVTDPGRTELEALQAVLRADAVTFRAAFGENGEWERGKSLERSLLDLEDALMGAAARGRATAEQFGAPPVVAATDQFYASWERLRQREFDVEQYEADKKNPSTTASKRQLFDTWDTAVTAIDTALAVISDEQARDQH